MTADPSWFYINAVHLDTDGNLLISARHAWAIYKVNLHTGNIIWVLGGKHSTFKLKAAPGQVLDSAGEIFAYQHDPEASGTTSTRCSTPACTAVADELPGGPGALARARRERNRLSAAAKARIFDTTFSTKGTGMEG